MVLKCFFFLEKMQHYFENGGPQNPRVADTRQRHVPASYCATAGCNNCQGSVHSSLINVAASTSGSAQGYAKENVNRPSCRYSSMASRNNWQSNTMGNSIVETDSSNFMPTYSNTSQLSGNYGCNGTILSNDWNVQSSLLYELSQLPAENLDVFNDSNRLLHSQCRLDLQNTDTGGLQNRQNHGFYSGASFQNTQTGIWNLPPLSSFGSNCTDISTHFNVSANIHNSHMTLLQSNHYQPGSQQTQYTRHQQLKQRQVNQNQELDQQLNHSQTQYQIHNVNDRNKNPCQRVFRQNGSILRQAKLQKTLSEQQHSASQPAYDFQNPSIRDLALTQCGTKFVHRERTMKLPACNTYVSTPACNTYVSTPACNTYVSTPV